MTETTMYKFEKPEREDFYDIGVQNGNWDKAERELNALEERKVSAGGGDISETAISSLENVTAEFPVPEAGESVRTFLGKVRKALADWNNFKEGIITLGKLANNCTTTGSGMALDARQGKVLLDLLSTHKSSGDHDGRYYTEGEINNFLAGKAASGHTHDNRYFTEAEINNKIVNNGGTTAGGYMLDARYGKTLADQIAQLNSKITTLNSYSVASLSAIDNVHFNINDSPWVPPLVERYGNLVHFHVMVHYLGGITDWEEHILCLLSEKYKTKTEISGDYIVIGGMAIHYFIRRDGSIRIKVDNSMPKNTYFSLDFIYFAK